VWDRICDATRATIISALPLMLVGLPDSNANAKPAAAMGVRYQVKSPHRGTPGIAISKPARTEKARPAKRYFHLCGMDVLLTADLDPMVLELNDRPSLSVTVPFDYDLKVKMMRDCFFHVAPGGECRGECDESDWQQIFPEQSGRWQALLAKAALPVAPGTVLASPAATNRMVLSGVNESWHQERRQRFLDITRQAKEARARLQPH
jgi:hypothetical protein